MDDDVTTADGGSLPSMLSSLTENDTRKQRIVSMLAGSYDVEFSEWLEGQGMPSNVEMRKYCLRKNKMGDFSLLIADHLGMNRSEVLAFIAKLKKVMEMDMDMEMSA